MAGPRDAGVKSMQNGETERGEQRDAKGRAGTTLGRGLWLLQGAASGVSPGWDSPRFIIPAAMAFQSVPNSLSILGVI